MSQASQLELLPRVAILIPAHNEEKLISTTVGRLAAELGSRVRIMVIADNCDDQTAAIAKASGAEVIERFDPDRRGKGYALSFGLEHLATDPPEVVIVIDADCRVSQGTVMALSTQAMSTHRPAQAEYSMLPPAQPGPQTMISALALLVRNSVRVRGQTRLGFPCQLGGTGMAFPWHVIRRAPATESHLVEDMLLGIALAEMGHPPLFCPEARVESELPARTEAGRGTRRRWEHGHLALLINRVPRLLVRGLITCDIDLLAMTLDLAVPPLSLLVTTLLGLTLATLALGIATHVWTAAAIATSSLTMVAAGTFLAWIRFGRKLVPLRYALCIPAYLLWKVPIYLAFAVGRRQRTWNRTERSGGPPA